jgi:translation initiation factor 1A
MPKNKGKGGKNFKKGKKSGEGDRRELEYKEDGQEYAQVTKLLGDGRVSLVCYDGIARMGVIRGTLIRRVWINAGDIVLVGLRDFEKGKVGEKCDVVHKYQPDEARQLQAYGEIPASAKLNQTAIDMAIDDDGEEESDLGFVIDAL